MIEPSFSSIPKRIAPVSQQIARVTKPIRVFSYVSPQNSFFNLPLNLNWRARYQPPISSAAQDVITSKQSDTSRAPSD